MPRIERDDLTGRTGAIWQAYIRGESQAAIARRHGISQQRVSQILADARSQVTPETAAEFNARTLDLMDTLLATHMQVVEAGAQPKLSASGKVAVDPLTGMPVPDWSQVLTAASGVVRVTERMAKILGSDAAAKSEVSVSVDPDEIEVVQRIKAWRAAQADSGATDGVSE